MSKRAYNPHVFKKPVGVWLLESVGVFTLIAVGVLGVSSLADLGARWLAAGLLIAFAAVDVFVRNRSPHLFAALQLAIMIGLLSLASETGFSYFNILFFILSADVVMIMPIRPALAWIGVFAIVTAASFGLAFGWRGIAFALPLIGGLFFFGAFGNALKQSQAEKARSERLLEELKAAQNQLQQLAIAEERNRLSRELHDSLGHRLTVAVVQLEGAQRLVEKDPARAASMIGAMREQMKAALGDLRRTVATLRAPLAGDAALAGPLDSALTRLAREFQENTGVPVHMSVPTQLPSLNEAQRLTLYRTAQESLTNTQKHAGAKNIWLEVRADGAHIALTTSDDGRGLPASGLLAGVNGGFGLRGLRERAAQVGGELELGARPGGGAWVKLSLPLMMKDE